jgi:septum formation protein
MSKQFVELVLASASPRRKQLLAQIGITAKVIPATISEEVGVDEKPAAYVERLACEKARFVYSSVTDKAVLAADTAIVYNDKIIGKPLDLTDAGKILCSLSGKTHDVLTGAAIVYRQELRSVVVTTQVSFREISEKEITAYCLSGEPMDKAGAYAIQGLAAAFIKQIKGSYSNVVGLPLCEVSELLCFAGIDVLTKRER